MNDFLQIYRANGWMVRMLHDPEPITDTIFESIATAEDWCFGAYKNCIIDHSIDGYTGDLMSMTEWKESCDCGGFIDYDGYGDLVDSEFKLIGITRRPSDYTKKLRDIPENAEYILWYNR